MKPPTEQELLAASRHQIASQRVVLWGQFYDVHDEGDADGAAEWLAEQVRQILDIVRHNRKES